MTEPKNIDEALLALQGMGIVVKKTADGAVRQGKADKYADLAEFNRTVLAALNGLGVVWKCRPTLTAGGEFVLAYSLKHVASGTAEEGEFPVAKGAPQAMGSGITYARRYALGAVTGIAAEDEDDDGDAASGRNYAQRAPRQQAAAPVGRTAQRRTQPALPGEDPNGPVGQDQHRHMHALWRELGRGGDEHRDFRLQQIAKWLELSDLESSADLTRAQAGAVLSKLMEIKDSRGGAA